MPAHGWSEGQMHYARTPAVPDETPDETLARLKAAFAQGPQP